ncbi:MAG TPA: glucosaminidase domain-containing protein [Rhizobacter sp.]|nr:glucosaminidase domain-containing protein [Rhizobacter sp.]
MLRPDLLAPASPLSPEALAAKAFAPLPAASIGGVGMRGASYTGMAADVAREVHAFIEQGGAAMAPTASPEGRWRAMQAAQLAAPQAADALQGKQANAPLEETQRAFLAQIGPWASNAAAALGVAPEVVQAHAALESGWGQRPLLATNGADAHNLFGVKASNAWSGDVVRALTTEVEDGTAVRRTEPFRRYADLGEAFGDYVRLLSGNPRYSAALNTGGNAEAFARALAQGGYATDPNYASKLAGIASQIAARR